MKLLHQIVGVLVVLIFLLTGQYMDFHDPHMSELSDGVRMMFRSRHIYILLAGLINVGLGTYFSYRRSLWRRVLQFTGSLLVMLAPLMLIGAFFYEPRLDKLQGPLTLPAIISLFAGVLLHMISGTRLKPVARPGE